MPLIASGMKRTELDQILNQLDKGRQPTEVVPCVLFHGKVATLALNIIRVVIVCMITTFRRKYGILRNIKSIKEVKKLIYHREQYQFKENNNGRLPLTFASFNRLKLLPVVDLDCNNF